jgi:hypothetical protein
MVMMKPIVILKASNGLRVSSEDKTVTVVCGKHQLVFEVRDCGHACGGANGRGLLDRY